MKLTNRREELIRRIIEVHPSGKITRKQLVEFVAQTGIVFPQWIVSNKELRVDRGVYDLNIVLFGSNWIAEKDQVLDYSTVSV